MNPLGWSDPVFLGLFMPLLLLSFLLAKVARWWLRQPGPSSDRTLPSAEPYEAALLRGRNALVETAVASLAHQGYYRLSGDGWVTTGTVPPTAPLIERIVFAAFEAGELNKSRLVRKAEPAIQELRARLVRRGWLMDDAGRARARWLPGLLPVSVLVPGIAKVFVGVERDKPVAFLLTICVLGLVALVRTLRAPWRSRQGDAVLRILRREQEPLKQTAEGMTSLAALTHRELALAVGLYGMSAVGYMEFDLLRRFLRKVGSSSWDTSSESGGDGDSGSDGDSGGGDGGGGDGSDGGGCGG
ncbi:TIGR04222 domain-containing membrane protein, partial [Pyxidicoccus fallax]